MKVKTAGSAEQAHVGLAIQLKYQMNDIIDVAYGDLSPGRVKQLKRFTIFCTTKRMSTKLGDCWHNSDGSSSIRVLALDTRDPCYILITAIHEVSHHIDRSFRGESGHDKPFYDIFKRLLCSAVDMGILGMDDISRFSQSTSRSKNKVVAMMQDYVPNPVSYKKNLVSLSVYNSFAVKDILKERGYRWNTLDKAWSKEIPADTLDAEKQYLLSLAVSPADIQESSSAGVMVRQRKSARLYGVPFEYNQTLKQMGFRWSVSGKEKFWEKKVPSDTLSQEEWDGIKGIPYEKFKIV